MVLQVNARTENSPERKMAHGGLSLSVNRRITCVKVRRWAGGEGKEGVGWQVTWLCSVIWYREEE